MENLLTNGGFETQEAWAQVNDATIQFTEPENAHAGKGFARLVPTATAAAALRQDDILLQPNTSYLLTYYAYPVQGGTGQVYPASYGSITYVDESGATKSIQESPRLPLIKDHYIQKRRFFTMPDGAKPFVCKVFIGVSSSSYLGNHIRVDDVALTPVTGNVFPKYGTYAWVSRLNERFYAQPDGKEVIFTKNTNDFFIIYEQANEDGAEWFRVRDGFGRLGWIRGDQIGIWTPPQLPTGKSFVTLNEDRVWPRNRDFNRCAYYWPKGRRVQVKDHDATYYETRYRGDIAYVEKSKCTASSLAVSATLPGRVITIAEGEEGRRNSRYFDNAQGNWSEAFVESLYLSVGISRTEMPCVSDPEKAILFWATYPTVTRYFFWNVESKRAFKARYPQLSHLSDELTSSEKSPMLGVGYLLYLLAEEEAGRAAGGRLATGVGMITKLTADTMEITCVDEAVGVVKKVTHPRSWRGAIGMATPNLTYVSQTVLP